MSFVGAIPANPSAAFLVLLCDYREYLGLENFSSERKKSSLNLPSQTLIIEKVPLEMKVP